MLPNTNEACDFTVHYKGEDWHVIEAWVDFDRKPQYYTGETFRKGVRFERTIPAFEIEPPPVAYQQPTKDFESGSK